MSNAVASKADQKAGAEGSAAGSDRQGEGGGKDQLPAKMAKEFLLGKRKLTDAVKVGLNTALHDRALVARILAAHKRGAKLGAAVGDKGDLGALVRDPKFDWGEEGKKDGKKEEGGKKEGGEAKPGVQQRAAGPRAASDGEVHQAATEGLRGPSQPLPHQDAIQRSFGRHDVSGIQAHVGGPAQAASEAMGASAYASGNAVAFRETPDLHTAAHEAAHVVQQRGGVQLAGGVGKAGDGHEQHADAVADRVTEGKSAELLLNQISGGAGGSRSTGAAGVQQQVGPGSGAGAAGHNAVIEQALSILDGAIRKAQRPEPKPAVVAHPPASSAATNDGTTPGAPRDTSKPSTSSAPVGVLRIEHVAPLLRVRQKLHALHSEGNTEEARAAAQAIVAAAGGKSASGNGHGNPGPSGPPVQRQAAQIAQGGGLVLFGLSQLTPVGWIADAVLILSAVAVGVGIGVGVSEMTKSRTKEKTDADVVPRVMPRDTTQSEHRGRLQVQGSDMNGDPSFPWAQKTPMTKAVALAELAVLEAACTPRQRRVRAQAFPRARAFIARTLYTAPPGRNWPFEDDNRPDNTMRVDVQIFMGTAFV